MLIFDYKKRAKGVSMTERIFPAKTDCLNDVLAFIEESMEGFECPAKTLNAVCVAIEEVFVNISDYAYKDGDGDVRISVTLNGNDRTAVFRISDKGTPFDPLKKPDPDITLAAGEREIGGLGIFIAKKTMDTVSYAYENGENVLTMTKKI